MSGSEEASAPTGTTRERLVSGTGPLERAGPGWRWPTDISTPGLRRPATRGGCLVAGCVPDLPLGVVAKTSFLPDTPVWELLGLNSGTKWDSQGHRAGSEICGHEPQVQVLSLSRGALCFSRAPLQGLRIESTSEGVFCIGGRGRRPFFFQAASHGTFS